MPSGGEVLVGWKVVGGAWSMPSEGVGVVWVRVMAEARPMPSPAERTAWSEERAIGEAVLISSMPVGSLLWAERVMADA